MKKHLLFFIGIAIQVTTAVAQTGITWNAATDIISANGNNHPRLALNRNGDPLLVWNFTTNCMYARWDGNAFTTPVTLHPSAMQVAGAAWMGPDIATHGDTVYVVFKQMPESSDTSHIFCVHSYDGGITFSQPIQVDAIADSISRFPVVTTDDLGNPIVAFMKFNGQFTDARWVVTYSTDFGNSFSIDTKASGWSSATSTVCDCCPGSIVSSGSTVAMVFRDNNTNIRDTWAGISLDGGNSFSYGMPVDQHNWNVFTCPSTGPDAVIIGDTLYAVFMNGVGGTNKSYMSASSISDMNGMQGIELTDPIPGLINQTYPRIASDGTAMAVVWKQNVNGQDQCLMRFTNDYLNGLPMAYDTVDLDHIVNADVALLNGMVYVVWQDDMTGTIKYRTGTFNSTTGISGLQEEPSFSVFPNPAVSRLRVESRQPIEELLITNTLGQTVYSSKPQAKAAAIDLDKEGYYFISISIGGQRFTRPFTVIH